MIEAIREVVQAFIERGINLLFQHVYLTTVAMALAIGLAVPVGLFLTRTKRFAGYIIAAVGVIQTVPSLALVGLMVPLLGAGPRAAIVALFLYALLPIVRNTYTGVNNVDPDIIEAARGMGMSDIQILFKIQLPLSMPVIMAGIRTSTVICVGVATLGGIIGAGGLGALIWLGIDRSRHIFIYAGAFPAMGLALLLDYILALGEKAFTSKGLQLQDSEAGQAA